MMLDFLPLSIPTFLITPDTTLDSYYVSFALVKMILG